MTRLERVNNVSRMVTSRNINSGVRVGNRKVVKQTGYLTKRQIVLIVVMAVLFMGSSIGYVWSTYEGTQIGYEISLLKKEERKLKEVNRKLRMELAMLKSPQNLESVALNAAGLKQPSIEQIIILP